MLVSTKVNELSSFEIMKIVIEEFVAWKVTYFRQ